jgi:methylglutamate dehydrogenase subunit B
LLRIPCPVCGLRDETEFAYREDAGVLRPAHDDTDLAVWRDAVFIRDNPRGRHLEYWHHVHGCREVLVVERDTLTHEFGLCRLARERQ